MNPFLNAIALMDRQQATAALDALLAPINAGSGRQPTSEEAPILRALHKRLDVLGGINSTRRDSVGAAERAAILRERPAPTRPIRWNEAPAAQAMNPIAHLRAVQQNRALAEALGLHEAGHIVLAAANGCSARSAFYDYAGDGAIAGANAVTGDTSAAGAVAGEVACDLAGIRHAAGRMSQCDLQALEAALGTVYGYGVQEAKRVAGKCLQRHWGTVAALAAALLETGRVEGAALDWLLAPVKRRALQAF